MSFVYSLLHLAEEKRGSPNLKNSSSPIDTYVRCAIHLDKSCRFHGHELVAITNDPEAVERRAKSFGHRLSTLPMRADRAVPQDVRFYSSHFKLDVFSMFANGECGKAPILLDLDCVVLNRLDLEGNFRVSDTLGIYDITEQTRCANGTAAMSASLIETGSRHRDCIRWYGGEFFTGSTQAFGILSAEVDALWHNYVENLDRFFHHSDEMVIAAALINLSREKRIRLNDCGHSNPQTAPSIIRWWTARTAYPQPSLTAAITADILHLPADKDFLADQSSGDFCPDAFVVALRRKARQKTRIRRIANPLLNLMRRQAFHVAKI